MSNLTPEQLSQISELSKQGYQLLKEGLTQRAIEVFRRIIELQPDNNYALVGLGDANRKQRNYKEAEEFYRECLNHNPDNNYALFGLADSYKAMKQFNRAIEVWEEYIKYDQQNITVLTRMADAYRKVRNFTESKRHYLRVLEIDESNSYAIIGMGHLNYDFKDYNEALKFWNKIEIKVGDSIDIRVLTSIGNCYRKLKFFDEGIPYFNKALNKQPKNFYALYGLACTQLMLARNDHQYIEAISNLHKWDAIKGGAPFTENHHLLVLALLHHRDIIQRRNIASAKREKKKNILITKQKKKISTMVHTVKKLQNQLEELEAIDETFQEKRKPL